MGDAGNDISFLKDQSAQALGIGKSLTDAGVSGRGTPFQQASVKSFTDAATANIKAYEKQAGVNDKNAGGAADIIEQANAMLGQFSTQDIQMGSAFLETSIKAATAAQGLQDAQDQKFGDALMSAAEVVAMIMVAA